MSTSLGIWLAAAAAYAAFLAWYVNWRGPMSGAEIDAAIEAARRHGDIDDERLERVRRFLEADDGREFFMVNLLRLHPGKIEPPGGGDPAPARQVMERYTRPFLSRLFRLAGHPAFVGRAAGEYVEEWNVESNPGWTATGIVRYRSRRDMAAVIGIEEFRDIHPFKRAAVASTFAFPAAPAAVVLGPVVWVGLLLALIAALSHLAFG